jgi:hypothetical protein
MKTLFLRFALTTGLSALLGSASLFAQTTSKRTMVEVPFSFTVGGQTLPAGAYVVEQFASNDVMWIHEPNRQGITLFTTGGQPGNPGDPHLVFRCYNDSCFLSEAWLAGDSYAHTFSKTRLENELSAAKGPALIASIRMK